MQDALVMPAATKRYEILQVVGENIESSGAVKEILELAGEKATQTNATKVAKPAQHLTSD